VSSIINTGCWKLGHPLDLGKCGSAATSGDFGLGPAYVSSGVY